MANSQCVRQKAPFRGFFIFLHFTRIALFRTQLRDDSGTCDYGPYDQGECGDGFCKKDQGDQYRDHRAGMRGF